MASLILSTIGSALFGPVGGAVGALAGSALDQALVTSLTPARIQPSRMSSLKVQGGGEGAAIPIVFGRARVTGQVIWAAQFKEHDKKRTIGGKGGQRVVERYYSISFALGLCDGPILGIGRVWVNGEVFDLSQVSYRLYLGSEDQEPDPLVEAVESIDLAPAFRGLAYLVFEDLAVTAFNDRIPNISVEVLAPTPAEANRPRLQDLARGVCLIPGAGEFAYATTPVQTIWKPGTAQPENLHVQSARTDLCVSLDNLARDLPRVDHVSLVVAWFGTDLRAGQCRIEPRVDQPFKPTLPRAWRVAGLSRGDANLVSSVDGRPAYGGTPEDTSVIEAITELKTRGHQVTLNPFVMMDVPAGNQLSNFQGGLGQPAYPWRGRITCASGAASVEEEISAFFGAASASHFSLRGQAPIYSGPAEWSYRRFILHQAMLAKAAGGVESFLIGSELVGLTHVRSSAGQFPAVTALKALASQVRLILGPQVKIGYAADWTEYGGYNPPGTQDLCFPLDPLWADPNIDFIGLDWYPPLTDRRTGEPEPDLAALQAGIEGGEGFDFYYTSEANRLAHIRTPITDGAYEEPWVWRVKDVRSFWSQAHFERVNGLRLTTPTPWVPQSKPIRLMELGFPAVDKAANRPSVFPDPKSSEAGIPPFSTGSRDDGEQRLALEASLSYWQTHSPISAIDGRPMIALEHIFLWTWDARPYPHFPQLQTVWGDGAHAATGHWLAGRAGGLPVRELLAGIGARAGVTRLKTDGVSGFVEGYVVESPAPARALIDSLLQPLGLEAHPRFDALQIANILVPQPACSLTASDFQMKEGAADVALIVQAQEAPSHVQVTTYASENDFEPANYRTEGAGSSGLALSITLPLVVDGESRQAITQQVAAATPLERLQGKLTPAIAACLQVGDRFVWEDGTFWRVDRLEGPWAQELVATPAPQPRLAPLVSHAIETQPYPPSLAAPPDLVVLDLPMPYTSIQAPKPLVGAFASPWPGMVEVRVADRLVANISRAMTYGRLAAALPAAPISRRLATGCLVEFAGNGAPPMSGRAALYGPDGVIDILSWTETTWVSSQTWRLDKLVRGYHGGALAPLAPIGCGFVVLDDALVSADFDPSLMGLPLEWTAAPSTLPDPETRLEAHFSGRAILPWSPCHLQARRSQSGIQLSWVRRASGDGDSWALPDVPQPIVAEAYLVSILNSAGTPLRTAEVQGPTYLYSAVEELADFGAVQTQITVSVCQLGLAGRLGFRLEERISVQHTG
jgi:hypothetical protein